MCLENLDNFFQESAAYLDNIHWRDNTVKTCKFLTWHCSFLECFPVVCLLPAVVHLIAYSLGNTPPEEGLSLKGRVTNDSWSHGTRFLACTLPFGFVAKIIHNIVVYCRKEQSETKNEATPLLQAQEQISEVPNPNETQPHIQKATPDAPEENQNQLGQQADLNSSLPTANTQEITQVQEEIVQLQEEIVPQFEEETVYTPGDASDDDASNISVELPIAENESKGLSETSNDTPTIITSPKIVIGTIVIEKQRYNADTVKRKLREADLESLKEVMFDQESMQEALSSIGVTKSDCEKLTLSDVSKLISQVESEPLVQEQNSEVAVRDIINLLIKKFTNYRDNGESAQNKAIRFYTSIIRLPIEQLQKMQLTAHENLNNNQQLATNRDSNKLLNTRDRLKIEIKQLLIAVSLELNEQNCPQFNDTELVWFLDAIVADAEKAGLQRINNPQKSDSLLDI